MPVLGSRLALALSPAWCIAILQHCSTPLAPCHAMQRGNWVAALLLLDRSARLEPRNTPVLRWRPVVEARRTVGERRRARGRGGHADSHPGSR